MGQLILDERVKNQDFIKDCSRHSPETMHRHLIRLDVPPPKPGVGRWVPGHENGFRDRIDTG